MEILVEEFLDNLAALPGGLAQAAFTILVLLGILYTILLVLLDVQYVLRRDLL